jgi:NADPH-dependent curcumin reductase CurA
MSEIMNREIRLAAHPVGWPKASDFELVETSLPEPAEGEVLARNIYMSVDPYMRRRMVDQKSYMPGFQLGEALQGGAIGRVLASKAPDFSEGDFVSSMLGWREYFAAPGAILRKIDPKGAPLSYHLGVLGMPGLTAYVGLLDIGQPKAEETVFVSAASGAVGSVVGQIAKLEGCRVVGSAGSDAKVKLLREELGFDAAFNYREVKLDAALAEACPEGIDIYFDNVGGAQLDAALLRMNPFGRIPACGMISQYNVEGPPPGLRYLATIIANRITLKGFIVSDHFNRLPDFQADMSRWLSEGKIVVKETVIEGIENAVAAFLGMLRGENIGKMIVKLGPDPAS